MQSREIVLLSIKNWLDSLSLSTWVQLNSNMDVFYINPKAGERETQTLKQLSKRLSISLSDCRGCEFALEYDKALQEFEYRKLNFEKSYSSRLLEYFGYPKGIVSTSASSPSTCIKAAALAVRLGYVFLPEDEQGLYLKSYLNLCFKDKSQVLPLIHLGSEEDITEYTKKNLLGDYLCLASDEEIYEYMVKVGLSVDYLVLVNSCDLAKRPQQTNSLGDLWVNGISLLCPLLASYRNTFIYDIASENPVSIDVEKTVNQFVKESNLKPEFLAIMASPGAIPFIHSSIKTIGSEAEEMVRDIHLQLNNDIFIDTAEGRLFQSTLAGLSLQILSSKYYHEINHKSEKKVLIATTPYVDTGIIFDSDDAIIEAYLKPLLGKSGNNVTVLAQKATSYEKVADHLVEADYFLYTGHGGQETLNTHGRYLTSEDLPELPPLIAYASACSTINPRPYWLSIDEGFSWEAIDIEPEKVIGLSLVEKGAVCFVGGASSEDLQYTTSVYSMFMEALLLKGMGVGEAVNETRNFVSLYSSMLNQKAPDLYRLYKEGTANFIHQQILLGDPALVPHPKVTHTKTILKSVNNKDTDQVIEINIPLSSWKRARAIVNEKDLIRKYYKSRSIEVITPVAENLVPWGDFYQLAPDTDGISDVAIMSNYLHVKMDLPREKAPLSLTLIDVEAGAECAICGKTLDLQKKAIEYFSNFKIPYLMLSPMRINMKSGWHFSTEILREGYRLHFLIPLLVIDDHTRMLLRAQKLIFQLKLTEGREYKGIVKSTPSSNKSFLVRAGLLEGNLPYSLAEAVIKQGEEFLLFCAKEAAQLTIEEQFPLYDLLEGYVPFKKELWKAASEDRIEVDLQEAKYAVVRGTVVDSKNALPLSGALIRAWRGKLDPNGYELIEGFIGEWISGEDGSFRLILSPGEYLVSVAVIKEGLLYKSKQFELSIQDIDEKFMVFPLDVAAIIKGKVTVKGRIPPYLTVKIKRFFENKNGETLASSPVRKNGSYECVISFQDRFSISIEKEGWSTIDDDNSNVGYKLKPNQELIKDFTIFPIWGEANDDE